MKAEVVAAGTIYFGSSHMSDLRSQLIGAAYHEAGRFVLALHYGVEIGKIELVEDAERSAILQLAAGLPLLDRVTICMGGVAAQMHFQAPPTDYGMTADYTAILTFTSEMTNEEREAVIEKGFVRARSIVAKKTDEVARIAKTLIAGDVSTSSRSSHGSASVSVGVDCGDC